MSAANFIFNPFAPGPADWLDTAAAIARSGDRCVLIFVARHLGSTPRETGTWALVSDRQCLGTLGGGDIERIAIGEARDLLAGRKDWARTLEEFRLGPELGQCCGGTMTAVFEPVDQGSVEWLAQADLQRRQGYVLFPVSEGESRPRVMQGNVPENLTNFGRLHVQPLADARPRIALYGCGHVGRAFVIMATQLPVRLDVIDERPEALAHISYAPNVRALHRDNPVSHARQLADTDGVLIMTHNHALDFRLCQMVLENNEISYIGLIGSLSKAARFRSALRHGGFSSDMVARLTCPIGSGSVVGKEPGVIAVAGWSEILQVLGENRSNGPHKAELLETWKRES